MTELRTVASLRRFAASPSEELKRSRRVTQVILCGDELEGFRISQPAASVRLLLQRVPTYLFLESDVPRSNAHVRWNWKRYDR